MSADAHRTRWLVLYGPHLFPAHLGRLLKGVKPVSSSAVVVHDTWLAFDVPGIPFLQPCYATALVKGFNDDGEWQGSSALKGEKGDARDGEEYKRWVWERACPGMAHEFIGKLPPNLEGLAYELDDGDFDTVLSAVRAASPATPSSLVPLRCTKFVNGDPSNPFGEITAELLVAQPPSRPVGLQPSQKYHRLIMAGAFLNVLSQPYLAHLQSLQPFVPSTRLKSLAQSFFRLLLLPSFLVFYLPSRLLSIPLWGRLGAALFGKGSTKLRLLESAVRPVVGSGYLNEDEHAAAQATRH
ncbi:hypothetical protein JCM8097_001955 [Rhodosporidiobolus ruineniae]